MYIADGTQLHGFQFPSSHKKTPQSKRQYKQLTLFKIEFLKHVMNILSPESFSCGGLSVRIGCLAASWRPPQMRGSHPQFLLHCDNVSLHVTKWDHGLSWLESHWFNSVNTKCCFNIWAELRCSKAWNWVCTFDLKQISLVRQSENCGTDMMVWGDCIFREKRIEGNPC